MRADAAACTAVDERGPCRATAEPGAPLALCTAHLLAAYDWVAREHGVTDLLPAACLVCGSRIGVRYAAGWACAVCEWRVGEVPDGELPPPRVDVVYYVRWRDRVKIGTSSNPRQRLAVIPHDEVLAFERGGRTLEHRRHAEFAASRWPGGEWFRLDEPIVRHVAELSAGVADPWDRYERWRSEELARRT